VQDRREVLQRQELVAALKLDFEIIQDQLATSIKVADSMVARGLEFLEISGNQDEFSLEYLGGLVGGLSEGIFFNKSLAAYESAIATGDIRLIRSSQLIRAIAEFYAALEIYENQFQIAGEIFYLGSTWELRREIGSARVLFPDPDEVLGRFKLTDTERRELFASKLVYALVQNTTLVNFNMQRALQDMNKATGDILTVLDSLWNDGCFWL